MRTPIDNHYLIHYAPRDCHSYVTLVKAASPLEAIWRYAYEAYDELTLLPDGSISERVGRQVIAFPHPLAYIESEYKANGEWQMRRVPDDAWEAPVTCVYCGEHPGDIEDLVDLCRPVFRAEFPRSRAPASVWYLADGCLVTFYRRRRGYQPIEILQRYIVLWSTYPAVKPFDGTHSEILERLSL